MIHWKPRLPGVLERRAIEAISSTIQPGAEVRAAAVHSVAGSGYLEGVFEPLVEPQYVLYGAHLIEVLEPETVEVVIDSPACAQRWGSGDLACWYRSGHGLILDSANHFDLQGLERVEGLEKAEDRKAWAVDHMGLP